MASEVTIGADNNTPLRYMHNGVTVADAYSLYKRLMGE